VPQKLVEISLCRDKAFTKPVYFDDLPASGMIGWGKMDLIWRASSILPGLMMS